jgi:radical SAM protein with 4Fe4S-binding SPASM domain
MLLGKDLQIYVKTTETCNLNCSHCFTSGSQGKKIFFNPSKTLNFLEVLSRENGLNSLRLVLHGGEPLLAPIEDLKYFYKKAKALPLNVNFAIQTNLAFDLTEEMNKFIDEAFLNEGIGTSWDADIRFPSEKKLMQWENNVKDLISRGHQISVMVCLSRHLIENYTPLELINYFSNLGIQNIVFERITQNGHAAENLEIFPSNLKLDAWLFDMHDQTIKHELHKKINNILLDEILKSLFENRQVGNRCRNCEQHLITINADGTLAGCPNSAALENWGHISNSTDQFLTSKERVGAICNEKTRNPICLSCEVKDVCNGDCYKLPWQDDICAAPKSLMKNLLAKGYSKESEQLLL